jgi:UDP-arabinose 4-epimerase
MKESRLNSTNVLITGGAGYIGSHACKALRLAGLNPIAFDNLSRGNREAVKWGELVIGDIRDTPLVSATLGRYDIGAVMHFAALANVGESVREPAAYYDINVSGTLSVLNAMREAGVGTILFSSSCATYGIPDELPVRESAPQQPINPYGRTKMVAELALRDYASAYGMRIAALRYFNAAGADGDLELPHRGGPVSHLIPLAIKAACGLGGKLPIFGTDYPTPDGTCIRDYVHVSDIAEAHVRALEALQVGSLPPFLNLGAGRGHSVREVVDMVAEVTRRTTPIEHRPRREGDPPVLVADPALARRVLGFHAARSDLRTIVRDAHASIVATRSTSPPPAASDVQAMMQPVAV